MSTTPKQVQWAKSILTLDTETVEITGTQGPRGETKTPFTLRIADCPKESAFPGGDQWVDGDGIGIPNPIREQWLAYLKDHEFADERRAGVTDVKYGWGKEREPRGPIVPRMETLRKQWIARRMAERGISEKTASEQWDMFNS